VTTVSIGCFDVQWQVAGIYLIETELDASSTEEAIDIDNLLCLQRLKSTLARFLAN